MNPTYFKATKGKGSALITVVFLSAVMAMLAGSILSYSLSERRGNERNRLILRVKNTAENISLYSAEQLIPKLNQMGSAPVGRFPWTGTSANRIYMPPSSILDSAYTQSSIGMEMRCGIQAASAYALVNDATDPNNGLQVATAKVPIIAKATATHPAIGTVNAYVEQDMQLSLTPLFQFGLFYNMDLEFFPGQDMTIMGPVHTNGRLTARGEQGGTAVITFSDRVTAAQGLYADGQMKATYIKRPGSTSSGAGGTGAVYYTSSAGTQNNLYQGGIWRDHKYGTASETTSTVSLFKTNADTFYTGNVRTNAHGVSKLELPGIGSYNETNLTTTAFDDRNSGRQIIEPRNPYMWNGSSWAIDTDDAATRELKLSRKCGLYIIVNPDDAIRTGKLPDGSDQTILPHSYRCWLNVVNSLTSNTLNEVVLPGQPTYGYNDNGTTGTTSDDFMYPNLLPNRYTTLTAVGSNQVLRIPRQLYTCGNGYLISGAHAINAMDINVNTGTGTIVAGETITIGANKYLVVSSLSGGVLKIAFPGLRAAVAAGTAVTVDPFGTVGTGAGYLLTAGFAIGANSITVDGSTGTILPGNSITIGAYKYLVTGTPSAAPATTATVTTINIAPPGLRAAVLNNDPVTIDAASGTLGTGSGYFVNNGAGYPIGQSNLALDTGIGTILPGNTIDFGGNQYLVASVGTALPVTAVNVVPALTAAVTDNTLVTVNPLPWSGYAHLPTPSAFPAETSTTPYPADAYFFDLRRANGNVGYNSNISSGSARSTLNYVPRPIAKIDFDMARFKMAVNRTMSTLSTLTAAGVSSSGYNVDFPTATNWANSIYNSGGATTTLDLGMDNDNAAPFAYTVFPDGTDASTMNRRDPFKIYYTPAKLTPITPSLIPADPQTLVVPSTAMSAAWYDGIAIYVHSVDAERRTQSVAGINDRVDSGVRLVNGRGPVVSLSTVTKTGFTFVTNDASYILGHFNADGSVNGTSSSTTAIGGYSARYPDSANEKLTSLMADAVTLLAQPVFSNAATPYYQTNGWNDALSAFRVTDASWTSTWRSSQPSSSNNYEGLGTSATAIRPGALPTSSIPGTTGAAWQTKLPTVSTEFSIAMLVGLIPSNHNATGLSDRPPIAAANAQYSGGAHNFPRLLEDYHNDMGTGTSSGLYIRGSMVALFESRVAMEPWNIRCYQAPDRYWGLHEGLRQAGHDIPLEPLVIGADRQGFRELTATTYATRKGEIEALPAIP